MQLKNKYAIVTGGSAGIGLAFTRALTSAGVDVLVVGRNQSRLDALRKEAAGISTFKADLQNPSERDALINLLQTSNRAVDILINNAGTMQRIDLQKPQAMEQLESEMALDLQAPMHLSTALLPALLSRPSAAIVNITSGLVYAPFSGAPGYCAAKAGLHAFTQALRWQAKDSNLQILEILPPSVATELTRGYGGPKIQPSEVANGLIKALQNNSTELRLGQANALYLMSRLAPQASFKMINQTIEKNSPKTAAV